MVKCAFLISISIKLQVEKMYICLLIDTVVGWFIYGLKTGFSCRGVKYMFTQRHSFWLVHLWFKDRVFMSGGGGLWFPASKRKDSQTVAVGVAYTR